MYTSALLCFNFHCFIDSCNTRPVRLIVELEHMHLCQLQDLDLVYNNHKRVFVCIFFEYYLLGVSSLVIITSAVNCLKRLVSKINCYVSSETLTFSGCLQLWKTWKSQGIC